MRDYVATNTGYSYETYQEWQGLPPETGIVGKKTYAGSYTSSERFRGNLQHSNGVIPTHYGAQSWQVSGGSFHRYSGWSRGYRYGWRNYRRVEKGTYDLVPDFVGRTEAEVTGLSFPSWVERSARAAVLERLASVEVDWGQLYGELPTTVSSLTQAVTTLLKAYRAARRGRWKEVRRVLDIKGKVANPGKTVADTWLAYSFGWKPVVQTIYDQYQFAQQQLDKRPVYREKAVRVTEHLYSSSSNYVFSGKPLKGCEYCVHYKIADSHIVALKEHGLRNPLALAWDLLPMSFVFDWVVPVGSFLLQLNAIEGLDFAGGYYTLFAKGSFTFENQNSHLKTNVPYGTFPSWECRIRGHQRYLLYTFPKPALVIRPMLDINRARTLTYLLLQRS